MNALLDNLAMALGTLRANPLRSLLTLLGIVIGASAVVAMMSLTEGLRLRATGDLASLGAGAFQIQKFPAMQFGPHDRRRYARRKDLTRAQGEALLALPHVAAVSIEEWAREPQIISTRERQTKQNVNVCGAVPDYERGNALTIAEGRFLSDVDVALGRRVAVVGADVADVLFPGRSALGEEVRIHGVPFRVVGVAARMGSVFGLESKDGFVTVPWPRFEEVLGKRTNVNLAVQATTPADAPLALDEVTATLRRLRGVKPWEENDFEVFSNESIAEVFDKLGRIVGAATLGVCALALLVGGIGVMNIMLVAVTERTREIGVRKALGATAVDIRRQFLVESAIITLVSGIGGLTAVVGICMLLRFVPLPDFVPHPVISPIAIAASLTTLTVITLFAGMYPAVRAAHLSPMECLRTE